MTTRTREPEIPVHDLDIERAVLGAAILAPDALTAVLTLEPAVFFKGGTRLVREHLGRLHARGVAVDLPLLVRSLAETRELEEAGGRPFLALLLESATMAGAVPHHLAALRRDYAKRELVTLGTGLADLALREGDPDVLIREHLAAVEKLRGTASALTWRTYDAAERWTVDAVRFTVAGVIPRRGIGWIGGAPKVGKTNLMLTCCLSIAAGRPTFAGTFPIHHRPRVVYVAREDGADRLQGRKDDILAAWPDARLAAGALVFLIRERIDLMAAAHVAGLRDLCRRHGATLLVLDTWTALSPSAGPKDTDQQSALARGVVQLAEDIDGAVVVVDHTRKARDGGQAVSSADLFGPVQKWAAAEHLIMLERTTDPARLEVFVEGKDADTTRFFLQVSPRGSGLEKFTYAGSVLGLAEHRKALGDANREKVHRLLVQSDTPLSPQDVMDATGLGKSAVGGHLTALVSSGMARRAGKGPATRYFALAESPGMSVADDRP